MSRDSRISEDPGKYFSETGSTRKCEIQPLFSDRDPNPRPNVGNCLRVELSERTSADIKLGTCGTGRSPRVRFHLWRNLNSSGNFDMERFSDRKDHSLALRQSRHWRMIMRKIELPRWRKIAKSWGFSAQKILLTSSALIPMKKAYSLMHGNAWPKFANFTFAPNFYL